MIRYRYLGIMLVIIMAARSFASPIQTSSGRELRGCWLTHYYYMKKSDAEIREAARDMKSHGINTVYVAMLSGEQAHWPSPAYQSAGGVCSERDWAAALIPIFRSEGLAVGAWVEYGFMVGAADHPIAKAHPDWLQREASGNALSNENGKAVFMSPGSEPAMAMLTAMCGELSSRYDFDDIQIDRFRWTRASEKGREFGYEQCTSKRYAERHGAKPPEDHDDPQWVSFREELVNQAVKRCYTRIKFLNPKVVVSSSPVGAYGVRQHMQRWSAWLEGGYIDLVMPQMYKKDFVTFSEEFGKYQEMAGIHKDRLACGLRAMETDDAPIVEAQIRYARSFGVYGSCLWVYHEYKPGLPAIRDELDLLIKPGHVWEKPAINPSIHARNAAGDRAAGNLNQAVSPSTSSLGAPLRGSKTSISRPNASESTYKPGELK